MSGPTSAAPLRVAYVAGWSPLHAPGLARYATELLAGLRRTGPAQAIEVVGTRTTGPARVAWSQTTLAWRLWRMAPDVCHVTAPPAALAWRGSMVLTLHDLSLLRTPGLHPRRRSRLMAPLLREAVSRASRLIVPSRATADDAERFLGVEPARIHVIPEAAAAHFRPITDAPTLDGVARRHGVRPGYVLAVGTLEPRKNLARLVDACDRLHADGWDGQLVLAGAAGWMDQEFDRRLSRSRAAVRCLGHVDEDDLPALLSQAGAVAYPSLLEGFGLPVVEALACGAVVVTADRGATAEVAGDAALLVDPEDTGALSAALRRALEPGSERDRLRAAGPVRAGTFSWDAAARETARVYSLAAGQAA